MLGLKPYSVLTLLRKKESGASTDSATSVVGEGAAEGKPCADYSGGLPALTSHSLLTMSSTISISPSSHRSSGTFLRRCHPPRSSPGILDILRFPVGHM